MSASVEFLGRTEMRAENGFHGELDLSLGKDCGGQLAPHVITTKHRDQGSRGNHHTAVTSEMPTGAVFAMPTSFPRGPK